MPRDLANEYEIGLSIPPGSNGTTTGNAVDFQDAEVDLAVLCSVGTMSLASDTITIALQESDDGSTGWTAVGGASLPVVVDGDDDTVQSVSNYQRTKRFVRANSTVVGTVNHSVALMAPKKLY